MAQVREIEGLREVRWAENPPWPPNAGRSPSQKAGLSFERAFGQHLQQLRRPPDSDLLAGPWIEFWDRNGHGFAQPDFLLASPRTVVILECKLTENRRAWVQLFKLYSPLLGALLPGVPQKRVQVCRVLRRGGEVTVVRRAAELQDRCIWQWIPGAQLRSRSVA